MVNRSLTPSSLQSGCRLLSAKCVGHVDPGGICTGGLPAASDFGERYSEKDFREYNVAVEMSPSRALPAGAGPRRLRTTPAFVRTLLPGRTEATKVRYFTAVSRSEKAFLWMLLSPDRLSYLKRLAERVMGPFRYPR
jgi:hypothetical protein